MRWYSTIESVQEGEISILAIVETVIAVSMSLGIFLVYGYYWHIVIGACIAPFLLLRTEYSEQLGLKWFSNSMRLKSISYHLLIPLESYMNKHYPIIVAKLITYTVKLIAFIIYVVSLMFMSIIIKILAIFWSFINNPTTTFTTIPANWYRVTIATDIIHPPEIMWGIEKTEHMRLRHFRSSDFSIYVKAILSIDPEHKIPRGCNLSSYFDEPFYNVVSAIAPILYVPAFLYSFSLKSTSLIYAPLIWIVSNYKHVKKDINIHIAEILESQYEYIKRFYAAFVLIFLFAIPLYVSIQWSLWSQQWFDNELINYFLPLKEIDSWHITRFLSAFITIIIWLYADMLKIRLDRDNRSWVPSGTLIIGAAIRTRNLCSLWTIGCGLYIVYTIVDWENLPSIRWFPF